MIGPLACVQMGRDTTMNHADTRADLAAAFRLTAREGMHEGVANHFSMAVNDEGTQFLINPRRHFSRIRASDLWVIDANNPESAKGEDAPDPTAWGLHASLHRHVPHARCAMHVHSTYATVLASLADSRLPPIVILTSNRTRDLHDALKRRCLYHWIDYPDLEHATAICTCIAQRACGTWRCRLACSPQAVGSGAFSPLALSGLLASITQRSEARIPLT